MFSTATALVESDEDLLEKFDTEHLDLVKNRLNALELNSEQLGQLMKLLQFDLTEGLKSEQGVVRMLPTFVSSNKTIMKSQSITLDLGGTGFRVYLIDSTGKIIHDTLEKIPENVKRGTENLMSFIASSIKKFFMKYKLPLNSKMPLGFTFSYPCVHNGLTSASLIRWTKGFCVSSLFNNVIKSHSLLGGWF
uniref:Phosphotransferase n=1 Tax=Meloidogyne javanica TaxID=6303 RepID=A0A915MTW2_MELJA